MSRNYHQLVNFSPQIDDIGDDGRNSNRGRKIYEADCATNRELYEATARTFPSREEGILTCPGVSGCRILVRRSL